MMAKEIRSTTIIGVRHKGGVAMAGDGQVTFGDMAFKQKAVKVREFKVAQNKVLGGFAGAAADALTLFEKFEQKLEQYEGDLTRATVELAKDWRMDKMLRHLDAMLVVMNNKSSFIILTLNFEKSLNLYKCILAVYGFIFYAIKLTKKINIGNTS